MRRFGRLSVVAFALALVLAACGGGDDSAGEGDDAGDGGRVTTAAGGGGGGGGDGVVTTFGNIPGLNDECTAVANLSAAFSQALTGSLGELPDDIVNSLPADARDDGRVLADALEEFSAGLQAAGVDLTNLQGLGALSPEQLEAWANLSETVFDEEVEDAVDRLSEAVSAACAPDG
jgi:hypothetical protein